MCHRGMKRRQTKLSYGWAETADENCEKKWAVWFDAVGVEPHAAFGSFDVVVDTAGAAAAVFVRAMQLGFRPETAPEHQPWPKLGCIPLEPSYELASKPGVVFQPLHEAGNSAVVADTADTGTAVAVAVAVAVVAGIAAEKMTTVT